MDLAPDPLAVRHSPSDAGRRVRPADLLRALDQRLGRMFFAIFVAGAVGATALMVLYRPWTSAPVYAALLV